MIQHYDLLILGGGCAGLSLARNLAHSSGPGARTLVIESRPAYTNDRTWCFWETATARTTHLVNHRWPAMAVSNARTTTRASCGASPYAMVPAAAFYGDATRSIAGSRHVQLQLNTRMTGLPALFGGLWRVQTADATFAAPMIIDTRPQQTPHPASTILWQSFSGVEVATATDTFDPETVSLMDFSGAAPGRILFTYVLPFTRRHALVEVTEFSPFPRKPLALEGDLRAALRRYTLGNSHTILRHEAGILPMGQRAQASSPEPTLVYAGLHAGGARPCTGYAFQRIQRWAADCASQLCRGELPTGHRPDPLWLQAMDHLFLEVLRSRPDLAPSMFLSMFAQADSRAIVRFLSDEAGLGDVLTVVASLPAVPFLKELANAFRMKAIQWQESLVS